MGGGAMNAATLAAMLAAVPAWDCNGDIYTGARVRRGRLQGRHVRRGTWETLSGVVSVDGRRVAIVGMLGPIYGPEVAR